MASTKASVASKVWNGSHRYGCECHLKAYSPGPGRKAQAVFGDGSKAPCDNELACPTASAEWNSVRAQFASASALETLANNLGKVADRIGHSDSMSVAEEIHVGLKALAEAQGT